MAVIPSFFCGKLYLPLQLLRLAVRQVLALNKVFDRLVQSYHGLFVYPFLFAVMPPLYLFQLQVFR